MYSKYVNLRPAYVTLVRDPVEKFISYYRFKRVDHERVKLEMAGRERHTPGSGKEVVHAWKYRQATNSGHEVMRGEEYELMAS